MEICDIRLQDDEKRTGVKIVGPINEQFKMKPLKLGPDATLQIDLGEVSYINSAGIRNWMHWVRDMKKDHPQMVLFLVDVPAVVINQINMIKGFAPEGTQYVSFEVPYFCEECDDCSSHYLKSGVDFEQDSSGQSTKLTLPDVNCPECQAKMTPDILPERFFRFLNPKEE